MEVLFITTRPVCHVCAGTLCRGNSVPTNYSHAIDCSAEDRSGLLVVSQTLWPEHCIKDVTAGSISAAFAATLTVKETDIIIRKGDMCGVRTNAGRAQSVLCLYNVCKLCLNSLPRVLLTTGWLLFLLKCQTINGRSRR